MNNGTHWAIAPQLVKPSSPERAVLEYQRDHAMGGTGQ